MIKRYFASILASALLLALPISAAFAEGSEDLRLMQVYVSGQTLVAFTGAGFQADELSCLVSNQSAEITASGSLSDSDVIVMTTVLVDISTSMPRSLRSGVVETLRLLVDAKPPNEQYRLITFAEELALLQDFTGDRYDLSSAIDKVGFTGHETIIYEAIYDTIPALTVIDDIPTFYRAIVITDGIDDTASGITKEELFIRLQNEHYPIDVVAVSAREAAEDRDLAAIVRMSSGRYFPLNPRTSITELSQQLGVGGASYLTATIPASMLDGTTRQVDISDGHYSASFDLKIPVFVVPAADEPPSDTPEQNSDAPIDAAPGAIEAPATSAPPSPVPVAEPTAEPDNEETSEDKTFMTIFGENTLYILIGACALLLFIAAAIVLLVLRSKKKKAEARPALGYRFGSDSRMGITEFFGDGDSNSNAHFTIKLSVANDPAATWTLPVNGELLIGRAEHCPVRIEENSVSREQCKIVVQGSGLAVVHLSMTNKTLLNSSNVTESAPVQSGDTLLFGRVVLQIDYIQSLGEPTLRQAHQQYYEREGTESAY